MDHICERWHHINGTGLLEYVDVVGIWNTIVIFNLFSSELVPKATHSRCSEIQCQFPWGMCIIPAGTL
jgi:hypothetical protein